MRKIVVAVMSTISGLVLLLSYHTSTNSDAVPPLHALHDRLIASNHWLQAYAPSLTPDSLGETLRFRFLDGQAGEVRGVLQVQVRHGSLRVICRKALRYITEKTVRQDSAARDRS